MLHSRDGGRRKTLNMHLTFTNRDMRKLLSWAFLLALGWCLQFEFESAARAVDAIVRQLGAYRLAQVMDVLSHFDGTLH